MYLFWRRYCSRYCIVAFIFSGIRPAIHVLFSRRNYHNLTEFIYVCRHLAWVQVLKRSLRLRGVRSLSPDLTSEHLYHFIRHFQDWQYIRGSMALRSTRPASLCGPSNAKEMFTCSCSDLKTRPARQSTVSALSADRAVYHITGNSTEQMSEEPSKRIFPDPLHGPPFL